MGWTGSGGGGGVVRGARSAVRPSLVRPGRIGPTPRGCAVGVLRQEGARPPPRPRRGREGTEHTLRHSFSTVALSLENATVGSVIARAGRGQNSGRPTKRRRPGHRRKAFVERDAVRAERETDRNPRDAKGDKKEPRTRQRPTRFRALGTDTRPVAVRRSPKAALSRVRDERQRPERRRVPIAFDQQDAPPRSRLGGHDGRFHRA